MADEIDARALAAAGELGELLVRLEEKHEAG